MDIQVEFHKPTSWHISVAAEAIAAGLFARCGIDVSVQYGANQPEYDLIVARGDKILKVSVKGSQDGAWGLCQKFIKKAQYQEAIDIWLKRHKPRTVLCFVQFEDVPITELPRVYIATPAEVAQHLKGCVNGKGSAILRESHIWGKQAFAAGIKEEIPSDWKFSQKRINQLLDCS